MGKRYRVTVRYSQDKEIGVWARDEEAAMAKAEEIVSAWNGVIDAEATEAEEDEAA